MNNRAVYPDNLLLIAIAALILAVSPLSSVSAGSKNASLMIDANSGKVLHAENASKQRYPASLTKLMTLYMTFDALRTGKVGMGTVLKASKKAASMPSTNLRMKKGDRITVRDAIKALVVRSANDVAVIMAEKLGGSEYKFAKRMTAVARRLGMQNTTFKNASGLPNRQQVTTARDMAVLALALRRHYPEYYHFFRTDKFKYKKKQYKSHNNAMRRITGADGLKTGYIRASGFNLITSATRRGKSIIGVVLGGETSKKRDDKMVKLVERTFARMTLQTNRRQFVLNNDPLPRAKPQELVGVPQQRNQSQQFAQVAPKVVKTAVSQPVAQAPQQYAAFQAAPAAQAKQYVTADFTSRVLKTKSFTPPVPAAPKTAYDIEMKDYQRARGQFMPVSYQSPDSNLKYQVKASAEWGVQVGAYEESREAMVAASNAASMVPKLLRVARIHVGDKQKVKGKTLYRARLADMTETQARKACAKLVTQKMPCFVYQEKNSSI
ncbi:MAG: D-alanyl-D-alanine carboxypeptidase [Rickettsiales bacterium]|nr:D-alanyl-D-alanine carboxypeptidase [Rickettsiales bacterium]